jgi:hypothetical protein
MSDFTQGTTSWRRAALPVSLILNLFLIAVIGGHVLRTGSNERAGDATLAKALANAASKLSGPDAEAFGAVMRREAPHYEEAIRRLLADRDALERQINSEPFNPEAARAAYAAWQQSLTGFTHDFGDALIAALGEISPAGRHRIIAARQKARTEESAKPER